MKDEFGVRVDDKTVRFERLLPGPIEKVWPYLADSDKRAQWFTSGALPAKVGEPFGRLEEERMRAVDKALLLVVGVI